MEITAIVIVATSATIGIFFAVRALTKPARIYDLDDEYRYNQEVPTLSFVLNRTTSPDYVNVEKPNQDVATLLESLGIKKISFDSLASKLETENFANGTENQSK
jgi:hypothetical protein